MPVEADNNTNESQKSDTPALLIGGTSIVGFAIAKSSVFPEIQLTRPSRSKPRFARSFIPVNLDDSDSVKRLLEGVQPRVVIYCHAVCDVSKCEANPKWAHHINVDNLARFIDLLPSPDHTRLIYVSSDHVFGSDGSYSEVDASCPISEYGRTRVAAESLLAQCDNTLILRAPLAIGPSADGKTGHRDWLSHRTAKGLAITVIKDEARSAVWSVDVAKRVADYAASDVTGLRHITATRCVDRPTLATHMCELLEIAPILKQSTKDRQRAPHLGRIELVSTYNDSLAAALPSPMDSKILKEFPPC